MPFVSELAMLDVHIAGPCHCHPLLLLALLPPPMLPQHYEGLARRAAESGHAVDVYTCTLDQTGLHEMRHLSNFTG